MIAELDDGADVIVREQKAAAPKETGRLESTIRRSKVRQSKKSATVTIRAGGRATTTSGGDTRPGGFDYAVEQEFGNKNMSANPFFYPAIRKNEDDIKRKVRKAFRTEVKDF